MAKSNVKISFTADTSRLKKATQEAEGTLQKFSKSGASSLRNVGKAAIGLGTAYAGLSQAKAAINTTKELVTTTGRLARSFGFTTAEASKWAAQANVRGVDNKALTLSFTKLGTAMTNAGDGAKGPTELFKKLGMTQDQIKAGSKDFGLALDTVSDKLAKMPAGAERNMIGTKLFGKAWQQLSPLLVSGSKAMQEQLALADKYGVTLGDGAVKSVGDMAAAQRESKMAMLGFQVQFGTKVIPILVTGVRLIADLIGRFRALPGPVKAAAVAVAAIGLAFAGGPMAAVTGFAAAALLIKSNWGTIGPLVQKTFNQVKQALGLGNGDIKSISAAVTKFGAMCKSVFQGLVLPIVKKAFTGIKQYLTGVVQVIGGVVKLVSAIINGQWGKAWQALKQIVSGAIQGMIGYIKAATAPIRTILAKIGAVIGSAFRSMWNTAKSIVSGGISKIVGFVSGTVGQFASVGGKLVSAIVSPFRSIGSKIIGALSSGGQFFGNIGRKIADWINDHTPFGDNISVGPIDIDLPALRNGGQMGGATPALVSPGEMIVRGSRAMMVPGSPVAADNVLMGLQTGDAVLTSHGQGLLAGGYSLREAIANQLPHFRKGGVVTASVFGNGDGNHIGATKFGYAELSNNWRDGYPHGDYAALGKLARGTKLDITYKGRTVTAPKVDVGTGGPGLHGHKRAIDLTASLARALHFGNGLDDVSYALHGKGGATAATAKAKAKKAGPQFGLGIGPLVGDAYETGFDAGTSGGTLRDLYKSVREAMNPKTEGSGGPNKKKSKTTSGATAGSGKSIASKYGLGKSQALRARAMVNTAVTIGRKHLPYLYGGGHGDGGKRGFDCSGYVSAILAAGGFSGMPMSVQKGSGLYTFGKAGNGKFLTIGVRDHGGGGTNAHTMVKLGDAFFESGGGHGPRQVSGWNGAFEHRTVQGFSGGGVVGGFNHSGTRDPFAKKAPSVVALIRDVAGASKATINGRVAKLKAALSKGATYGQLAAAQKAIRAAIKRIGKSGVTSGEKPVYQRLRGSLTLVQGATGLKIGKTVAGADTVSSGISDDEKILGYNQRINGIDSGSVEGLTGTLGLQNTGLASLQKMRGSLSYALKQAKKTKNSKLIAETRAKLKDVDTQILSKRADIADTNKAIADKAAEDKEAADDKAAEDKKAADDKLADAMAEANRLQSDANELAAQAVANQQKIINLTQTQGPAIFAGIAAIMNGDIGGRVGLGVATPGYVGQSARY